MRRTGGLELLKEPHGLVGKVLGTADTLGHPREAVVGNTRPDTTLCFRCRHSLLAVSSYLCRCGFSDWIKQGAMTTDPIESFLDEIREAAKVRGLLTEDHVQIVRKVLVNSRNGAGDDVRVLQIWDDIRGCISDKTLTVKERLAEMGRIADLYRELHSPEKTPEV